jgi:nitroreductase
MVGGAFQPIPREVTAADMRVVVHKSVALAAQTFMLSMQAEGYDTCPMEGFDSRRVKKFLGLPRAAEITMIVSVGTAKPEGIYGKRIRIPNEEVIFEI